MADENRINTASWVNLLAGAWLILSPFMFRSLGGNSAALRNNIIVGVLILLVSIYVVMGARAAWVRGAHAILGAWIFLSPFILGFSHLRAALWNNLVLGFIVFVIAASGASMAGRTLGGDRFQSR